ncbi:translational machinery component [Basidiobolus meristosporus CBS 931.73]|uniref:Translational machinery component n=1 Tax=Basidiobolus meristosporus CBS 931.73 TaxID=1314790 RepID=A0A1Y1XU99_9FUNG|nr:translational machinery component [Basidiobolus meristosporus CBS 931.73]|eukprot:ORX89255.1 translational machinery component [Basidiobolus meristosporus CBS 931.73]
MNFSLLKTSVRATSTTARVSAAALRLRQPTTRCFATESQGSKTTEKKPEGGEGNDSKNHTDFILETLRGIGSNPNKGARAGAMGTLPFDLSTPNIASQKDQGFTHCLSVHASYNNTIVSLTNADGRVLVNASGGTCGFKKANRGGYEPAYQATTKVIEKVKELGLNIGGLHVKLRGFGPGRDAAFKAVRSLSAWNITRITDATPVPFNGCRPRKPRRL